MEPKEKAKELIEKYLSLMNRSRAMECHNRTQDDPEYNEYLKKKHLENLQI